MTDKPDKRTRHGITTWIKQGQLPSIRGKRKVKQALEEFEAGIIEELGGMDKVTPQQLILIHSTKKALGVILLAELYINKAGLFRPDQLKRGVLQFHPVLEKSIGSFYNMVRLNLTALFPGGLSQKAEEALNLGKYINETYGMKK